MSKAQHTPWPWTYREINDDSSCIVEYGDYAIAKTFAFVDHQRDSHTANARLIAAAPELLEIAIFALEYIDAIPKDAVLPAMPGFDRDWANNVIAKATGE